MFEVLIVQLYAGRRKGILNRVNPYPGYLTGNGPRRNAYTDENQVRFFAVYGQPR